jgi:SAM-dependent methyltransferase
MKDRTMSTLAEAICFKLAKARVLKRQEGAAGERSATFDPAAYQAWRKSELQEQFAAHFSEADVRGKDVVDFGCGGGELSFLAAGMGAKSVLGLEVDRERYEMACAAAGRLDLPVTPTFQHSPDTATVDRPDSSCDVILCFDVLEHILDYRTIIPEWHRILRPGGHVLIWWMPYYHPWGHHVESLVPLPWVHAAFSDRTVINTCAAIYDMPEFRPRIWDLDDTGKKKPNKWRTMDRLPTLNKLTIRSFEDICRGLGFSFDRKEYHPISSSGLARKVSKALISLPPTREYFTSVAIYDLRK